MKSRYGKPMSKAERKAMDVEIRRELEEWDWKHSIEIDAMILWVLHEEFGFGPKRLKQFFDRFACAMGELKTRYDIDNSDLIWLCTRLLKSYGIDLEEWEKEALKKA